MSKWYFSKFEHRTPPKPLQHSAGIEMLWQYFAILSIVLGAWYLHWRWTSSLNMDALWYAVPLVFAETGAYIGLLLFTFNLWKVKDPVKKEPPHYHHEVVESSGDLTRKVSVDIFFTTYDEDPELVRLSIADAKKVEYPHDIDIVIYVLDDGRRQAMRDVADEEGVQYISRDNNIGFKAGNLRNAMERTSGDFIVICDADTRPFPTILKNTLGYFRDPDVAWVQTPQWFFDLPEGCTLTEMLESKVGGVGRYVGKGIESVMGPIRIGEDPFSNDPKLFYDVILRRRNWSHGSFCCGAGSIHRRDAVMRVALIAYSHSIDKAHQEQQRKVLNVTKEKQLDDVVEKAMYQNLALEEEMTPYKFHVSEDIYTSMVLHSDTTKRWKSVLHPSVESKMLSPQDLLSWTIQRFKYAGGTLDIALHDNPIFRKGMSLPNRVMYASTIWSYFGGIWNAIFLLSPLIYLYFAIAPVNAFSIDFFLHFLPFVIVHEIATMFSTWGLSSSRAKFGFIAFFSINLQAIWTVVRGKKISFPVTPKVRQEGNFVRLVWPQLSILVLTIVGLLYAITQLVLDNPSYDFSSVLINVFWGLNNIFAVWGMVRAAFWKPESEATATQEEPAYV